MRLSKTLLAAAAFGAAPAVFAANYFWDGGIDDITANGNAASAGGDGTWDLSTKNWDPATANQAHRAWVNGATPDTATFGGTAGTVTLWDAITTGGLTFATDGYVIDSFFTPLTLAGATPIITVNSLVSATIAAPVAGTNGFNKQGTGTLVLTGENTYSGTTTITAGTLRIDDFGTLGGGAYAGNIVNGGIFQYASSSDQVLSGIISGSGSLAKSGAGTLTLSGVNTYTGTTDILDGTLKAGSTSAFGNNSAVTVGPDGTLDLGGFSNTIRTLEGAGVVTNSGGAAATLTVGGIFDTDFSGSIQDGASVTALTKNGSGTMSLWGENTHSGATTVNAGTLRIAGNGSIDNSAVTVKTGAILVFDEAGKTVAGLTLENASTLALGAVNGVTSLTSTGALNFTGSPTVTIRPIFAALPTAGTITLVSAASVTGSATINTDFTTYGATRITGNTALVGNDLVLNITTGAANLVWNNATGSGVWNLNTSANFRNGSVNDKFYSFDAVTFNDTVGSTSRNVTLVGDLAPSAITVNTAGTYTFGGGGSIAGGGSLTKQGTGRLVLNTSNSFTGNITITGGTVQIGGTGNLGDTGLFAGGNYGGDISIASGATFQYSSSSDQILSGNISGAGTLIKDTSFSTLTLSGANTYTGSTRINAGTVALGSGTVYDLGGNLISSALGVNSAVTILSGATLDLNGFDSQLGSLAGAGTVDVGSNHLTVNALTSATFSGLINDTPGAVVTKTGAAAWELNAYLGNGTTLEVNQGELRNTSLLNRNNNTGVATQIVPSAAQGAPPVIYSVSSTADNLPINPFLGMTAHDQNFYGVIDNVRRVVQWEAMEVRGPAVTIGDNARLSFQNSVSAAGSYLGPVASGTGVNGNLVLRYNGVANVQGTRLSELQTGLDDNYRIAIYSSGVATDHNGGNSTIGVLSGAGRVYKTGMGSLTVLHESTFTGDILLTEGTTILDSANGRALYSANSINLGHDGNHRDGNGTNRTGTGSQTGYRLTLGDKSFTNAPDFDGWGVSTLQINGNQTIKNLQIYRDPVAQSGSSTRDYEVLVTGTASIFNWDDVGHGLDSNIDLGGNTLTIEQSLLGWYSGTINGSTGSRVKKTGTGDLVFLGGNSSYDTLEIAQGRVISNVQNLPTTVTGAGTLQIVQHDAGTLTATLTVTNLRIGIGADLNGRALNGDNYANSGTNSTAYFNTTTSGTVDMAAAQPGITGTIDVADGIHLLLGSGDAFINAAGISISNNLGTAGRITLIDFKDTDQTLRNFSDNTYNATTNTSYARLDLGKGSLTLDQSTTPLVYGGQITGAGAFIKTGAADVTIVNAVTYTGPTVVEQGKLTGGAENTFGASSALVVAGGGVFDASGKNQTFGALFGTGSATVSMGAGNLTIGLNPSFEAIARTESVDTTVGALTTHLHSILATDENADAGVAGSARTQAYLTERYVDATPAVQAARQAAFVAHKAAVLNPSDSALAAADAAAEAAYQAARTAALADAQASALAMDFAGVISGTGKLIKIGTQTLNLTGLNTYTGVTDIQGGTLQVDTDAIAQSARVDIAANATLAINVAGSADETFANTVTGGVDARIDKVGTGTLTLSDNIAGFSGALTVSEGTLRFNVEVSQPSAITVASGATLALNTPTASALVDYTGTIANNGTIRKEGAGTLNLATVPNPAGAIVVAAGTLSMATLPTGALEIQTGATFESRVPGTGQPGAPLSFTNTLTGAGTLAFVRADTTAVPVSAYLVTLTPSPSPSTFTGVLQADDVTLRMGASDAFPTVSIDLINGGVLDLNGTTQSFTGLSGDATAQILLSNGTLNFDVADTAADPDKIFSGNLEGPGTLNKSGLGTLSLQGTATGGATFNVAAGTLEATSAAVAAGTVNVADLATFAVRNDSLTVVSDYSTTTVNLASGATLAKTGAGEVIFNDVGATPGALTHVMEGTLTVNTPGATVFTGVTVDAGAALKVNISGGPITHDSGTTNAIAGEGDLAVSGANTLTLSGVQSYTGNTVLLNGANLAFSGTNTMNGLAGDVGTTVTLPAGGLTISQLRDGVFNGTFIGADSVTITGTSVLTLSDAATASLVGPLVVDAGSLEVSGTNATAVTLLNGGELRVDVTGTDVVYAGTVISSDATNSFIKTGTGTLDLTATLASGGFAGFTAGRVGVAEGTLTIDPTAMPTSVTGLVTKEAGTLALDVADTDNPATTTREGTTLALPVTGDGILEKSGAGTLYVNGSQLTGFTGTLLVSQGRLGGTFTTGGGLTVNAGGTLAPGNSPGTVTVSGGDFTLNTGGIYEVEMNATTADKVVVTNGHNIVLAGGNLVVKQDNTPGSSKSAPNTTYTILETQGGGTITGAFGNETNGVVQLAAADIATTGIARVRLTRTATELSMTTIAAVSTISGLHEGLSGLVGIIDAGALPGAVQNAVDTAVLAGNGAKVVNNLSPLGYASEYAMAQDGDNRRQGLLHDRLEQRRYDRASPLTADEAPWEAFAVAGGSFADNKVEADTPTFDYRTFGGLVGLDNKISDTLVVGAAVGYDNGTATVHDNGGKIEMSRGTLTGFVGTQVTNRWYVDGGATLGYASYDGKRRTALGALKGSNTGVSFGAYVETGTILAVSKDFHITPYAGLAYTHHEFGSFTESGNASALKVDSWSNDSMRAKLGTGFGYFLPLDAWKLKVGLDAAFAHELLDTDSEIDARFASSGSKFRTTAAALPQDTVGLTPSLGVQFDETLSASVGYTYEMGFDGRSYQSVNFSVRKRF